MSRSARRDTKPAETVWSEEWIPLTHIALHQPLQVRRRLDPSAVKRYRDMTKAGSEPPPIKVGRCKGVHYLVDGWHRIEAGALVRSRDFEGETIKALVADLTEAEVRWEAAKANMCHGVPLKASEYRGVLKAFIKAGKHRHPNGELMSYRELGAVIGKGHTTVRTWIIKDFPRLARQLGGREGGNDKAEPPPGTLPTLQQELRNEAMQAMRTIAATLAGMTPVDRWELVQQLEAARNAALREGVEEPEF